MNKKFLFSLIVIIFIAVIGLGFYYFNINIVKKENLSCTKEAKSCPDGTIVGRVPPKCDFSPCPGEEEGIFVLTPKTDEVVQSPLMIEGKAKVPWFFEAEFKAELYDENKNLLGTGILTAQDDWMKEDFVPFKGEIEFKEPSGYFGVLRFMSANPSGLPEQQKQFEVVVRFK